MKETRYPKITLITPSFNQGRFLEETIRSVLDQQYPNLEYMIIDGGSTDLSADIINQYKSKLAWTVSEKDRGQAHAVNKGLQRATGEVIGWLNSDDYFHPEALFRVGENFNDPSFNCVIGKIEYFTGSQPSHRSKNVIKHPVEKTIGSGTVPQPAMFFRKSCYDEIGLLNEKLDFCFDGEWYMRYLIHYGIEGIKEINDLLVHFRFHHDSKTMTQDNGFNRERNTICYSIASQLGLDPLKDLLAMLYEPDLNYRFDIPSNPKGTDLQKAMNYFVMQLGNEFYARSEREKAKLCFNLVNTAMLDSQARSLFNRLKFRNSYLPAGLIRLFRKR